MKKIISLSLSLLLFTMLSYAQRGGGQGGVRGQRNGQMRQYAGAVKKLNLSDAQKTQLKASNEAFRNQVKSIKSNDNLTQGEARTQLKAAAEKQKTSVQSILTPEQKAQLGEMKEKRGEKAEKGKRGFSQREHGIKGDLKKLNLTETQKADLKNQRDALQTKIKAIKDNSALSKEDKKTQIKALMQGQKDALKNILTPEQLAQLKEKKRKG